MELKSVQPSFAPHRIICFCPGETVLAENGHIPGAVGENDLVDTFTDTWCHLSGASVVEIMRQRIYKLTKLNPIKQSQGHFRIAEQSDKGIVTQWGVEMHHEIFGHDSPVPPESLEQRVNKSEIYLWEVGAPVSMAGKCRPVNKGVVINAVYTPPLHRKQGYATSCVHSLCQLLLNSGYEYVSLYTDLANPASNSIYQTVGFVAVCDSTQVAFKVVWGSSA